MDIAYLADSYPVEDTKTQALDQFIGPGGPATNAAVAYAALGGTPTLVTAIRTHRLGDLIRNDLAAHDVRIVDVRAGSHHQPPVSSIVVAESAATRTIVSLDGARIAVEYDHRLATLLTDVNVVLVDGHYPTLAAGLCERARSFGAGDILHGAFCYYSGAGHDFVRDEPVAGGAQSADSTDGDHSEFVPVTRGRLPLPTGQWHDGDIRNLDPTPNPSAQQWFQVGAAPDRGNRGGIRGVVRGAHGVRGDLDQGIREAEWL